VPLKGGPSESKLRGAKLAYTIIAALIVVILGWAVFKSRRAKKVQNEKFVKPNFRGPVRRFPLAGRKIVQSHEQKAAVIRERRGNYDPSIDLLDPSNKNYRKPEPPTP
jgi:hypothetical protein